MIKMKNVIVNFVDWYLKEKDAKDVSHYFSTREDGFELLSECAAEFAKAYGYNPFIDYADINQLQTDIYKKGTSFHKFSESRSSHVPRAVLGNENYLEFLKTLKKNSELLKQPRPKAQQSDSICHYDKDELRKNFFFRLITQDRYYEFLYFPISVLKKLFYRDENDRKFFDKWIDAQIDKIVLHTGESTTIPFKNLNTLDISRDGTVVINDKFKLHTVVANTDSKEEICTYTLQNIVIDHVEPFYNVLFELKEKLPTLQKVHNALENLNDGRISSSEDLKKAGNDLVSDVELFNAQELAALKKELDLISGKIQLQLMERYQNLYKKRKN
ncbi:hypothetical protein AGMMS4957_15260 [Bacteroidia bacterium]|nr:hypothetical protein AGMMS4957_15260 [Bacteroidia bacterium]